MLLSDVLQSSECVVEDEFMRVQNVLETTHLLGRVIARGILCRVSLISAYARDISFEEKLPPKFPTDPECSRKQF